MDFTKLKKAPTESVLKKLDKGQEKKTVQPVLKQNKEKSKKAEKLGRPNIENPEKALNVPLTVNVTEAQYNAIIDKAGLIPVATFLRSEMQKAGIIQ